MLYNPNWGQTQEAKNRLALIALLRDRASWPPHFQWNFNNCSTCAIGLAFKTKIVGMEDLGRQYLDPLLGLTDQQGREVFAPMGQETYGMPRFQVTPEMVADHLETVHARLALAAPIAAE